MWRIFSISRHINKFTLRFFEVSSPKVKPAGLNDRRWTDSGVLRRLYRLGFYTWQVLPGRTGLVPPANDWTTANYSRILWRLGIAARWMWLMQEMKSILKSMVYTTRRWAEEPLQNQRPRSPSSVSESLQPSVALASTVGTSYRKKEVL